MGAGRKTSSYTVDTVGASNAGFEAKQRNLGKNLGGVIFMCNRDTMRECAENLIFGLPSVHWCYVQYIQRGMPIFLYNFSDRQLHGIYRAIGDGAWEINPHGWTGDDESPTRYPAQVQVEVHLKCPPLSEKQFHSAISGNYHRERGQDKFKQELDKQQAAELCALFHRERARLGWKDEEPQTDVEMYDAPDADVDAGTAAGRGSGGAAAGRSASRASTISWENGGNNNGRSSREGGAANGQQANAAAAAAAAQAAQAAAAAQQARASSQLAAQASHAAAQQQQQPSAMVAAGAGAGAGAGASSSAIIPPGVDILCDSITELKNTIGPILARLRASPVPSDPLTARELSVNLRGLDEALMQCQKDRVKLMKLIQFKEDELKRLRVGGSAASAGGGSGTGQVAIEAAPAAPAPAATNVNSNNAVGSIVSTWRYPSGSNTPIALLIGGMIGTDYVSSCEVYSPQEDSWSPGPEMPVPRAYCGVATVGNNVYVVGGGKGAEAWLETGLRLDVQTGGWSPIASMARPRGSLACVSLNGKIYAIGGGITKSYYSAVEVYDPSVDAWRPVASLNSPHFSTGATEINNAIYCCGGYDGQSYLNTVERLDPREGKWTQVASLCTPRGALAVASAQSCVWAIGGYNGMEEGFLGNVEKYDPRMDKWGWAPITEMPEPRAYGTAFAVNDELFVFGGMQEPGKNLATARYSATENMWWSVESEPSQRRSMMAAAVVGPAGV